MSSSSFLGPAFIPSKIPSEELAQVVCQLTISLEAAVKNGSTPYGDFEPGRSAVAVLAKSLYEQSSILDFSYTSQYTVGHHSVSKDSIFRIGIVSKVFTVYSRLANSGFRHFDDLVIDHVPELKNYVRQKQPTFGNIDWRDITLGALTSQLSGIPRDYNLADLTSTSFDFVAGGLPPLNSREIPQCGITGPCSRSEFFDGILCRSATFAVYQTPAYSNAAFRILAYAIGSILGRSYGGLLCETVTRPQALNHTSLKRSADSVHNVLSSNDTSHSFDTDVGHEALTGGMYSSATDLVSFGNSILSNTQLSHTQTNRWLKSHSHTAAKDLSAGMVWEISRATLGGDQRVVDLYTKSGGIGVYTSQLILLPDYGVTIALLVAGPNGSLINSLSNMVTDTLLPALEDAARSATCETYCGTYSAQHLNSTLSLITDDAPGLLVQNWISNGSNVIKTAGAYAAATDGGQLTSIRLLPAVFDDRKESDQTYFRAVFETEGNAQNTRLFRANDGPWASVDQIVYWKAPVDEFVFSLRLGQAIGVMNTGLRCHMGRE